jgi:putative addiction module component (TIGR02574 family)
MAHSQIDLDALTPEEQLELLDRLWERVGRNPDLLTPSQVQEVDARSDELDRDLAGGRPGGIPWDEVLRRMKAFLNLPTARTHSSLELRSTTCTMPARSRC